jgi:hypothetical protein
MFQALSHGREPVNHNSELCLSLVVPCYLRGEKVDSKDFA